MVDLIITEKPNAANKIAHALADGKPLEKKNEGVSYYEVTHGHKDIIVACAVGHLYTVVEKNKGKWTYPIFDTKWVPTYEASKSAAYSRKYLSTIKKLVEKSDSFTVATDYDIEGEVIGLNVIKYACEQKDACRMKFSTLTVPELRKAYDKKSPHIDWGQANAGETRHVLDWLYGINVSRALTLSIKAATGSFKLLSSGRVQGPALKLLVEKEEEISSFKPVPYWQIEMICDSDNKKIDSWHKEDKFWNKDEAAKIFEKIKGEKKTVIAEVKKTQTKQEPPFPFDLTSLQIEAHKCLGIPPKTTLEIAQNLYTNSFISYPRTSSQKLPKEIGYKTILEGLSKLKEYSKICKDLLAKKELKPNEGPKVDEAHPAIFPTGENPYALASKEKQLYDLISRRFFSVFGEAALRETMTIELDVKKEIFIAKGTRTVEKGWHNYYGRYVMLKEEELPAVSKGQKLDIKEIKIHDKQTQPPRRYTAASIIKELEKRNLGTKATRAEIVDSLYRRGYVDEKSIQVTNLGMRTCKILEKYCPEIQDEKLTRDFEDEMEEIRHEKKTPVQVIAHAKDVLTKILDHFKLNEMQIGSELQKANIETRDELGTIGKCPKCLEGTLMIRKGKFGMFIACNKYPGCKTTFKLPSNGLVKPAKKTCEKCGYPQIIVIKKRKRPQEVCINPNCPGKEITDPEKKKEVEAIEKGELKKDCPRCKEGQIILRKSVYGVFYACNRFPKCRYIEAIQKFEAKELELEKDDEKKEANAVEQEETEAMDTE